MHEEIAILKEENNDLKLLLIEYSKAYYRLWIIADILCSIMICLLVLILFFIFH